MSSSSVERCALSAGRHVVSGEWLQPKLAHQQLGTAHPHMPPACRHLQGWDRCRTACSMHDPGLLETASTTCAPAAPRMPAMLLMKTTLPLHEWGRGTGTQCQGHAQPR